jgi:hypothetical protein
VEFHGDLLCLWGDVFQIVATPWGTMELVLAGRDVGVMEGEDYEAVCAGRQVDDTDRCDQWRARATSPAPALPQH